MVLIRQIVKFASILLYVIVVNLAHAGNDKGYLNLNMKDHNLNIKSYDDRDIISAIMNKVGTYDSKHKCYVSNVNEYRFCLNLVSFNMVDGGLVYNLGLSGYELNRKYNTGLFLALEYSIFEVGNGLRFRSINGFYGVGTVDAPLKKSQVKLIEIADRKYAWELKDYNFGYGVLSEKTTLINQTSYNDFMPQKKIIVFDSLNDNSGKCGAAFDITCEEKRVEYKFLENNSKQKSVKDIELKFIQKEDNIIKKTHTEIINYDTKNYQYNLPSEDMISYMEKKVSLIPSNTNNNYQSGLKNFQKSEYECVNKANEKIILKIDYKNKSVNWANKISVDVVYDAASEGLIAYYDNRNTNLFIKGDIVYYTENNKKSVLNCS